MVENVFKNETRLIGGLDLVIPILMKKSEDLCKDLDLKVKENLFTQEWNLREFQELLVFSIDGVVSLYKFLKVYPAAADFFHRYNHFEIQ
jgi:hypothetical protein